MVPVVLEGQGSDFAHDINQSLDDLFNSTYDSSHAHQPCPDYPRAMAPPASPSASASSSRRRRPTEGEAEGVPPNRRPRLEEADREVAVRALSNLAHALDDEASESIRRIIRK